MIKCSFEACECLILFVCLFVYVNCLELRPTKGPRGNSSILSLTLLSMIIKSRLTLVIFIIVRNSLQTMHPLIPYPWGRALPPPLHPGSSLHIAKVTKSNRGSWNCNARLLIPTSVLFCVQHLFLK